MPKDTLSPGLKQFLDQLRQQPPEHMRSPVNIQRAWRHWQKQVEKAVGPGWRKDPEWAGADQRWRDLDQEQAAKKPARSRAPKHAGGNSQILTNEEIAALQIAYEKERAKAKPKSVALIDAAKRVLPKNKQQRIKPRTLRHYAVTLRNKSNPN